MAEMPQIIGIGVIVSTPQMLPNSSTGLLTEIFLVYGSLRTGGIETLIVRMANFFVSAGVRVSVCCTAGGELESSLDGRVNIISYIQTTDLVGAVQASKAQMRMGSTVLIISFDPISAARALIVERALFKKDMEIAHISGVFHPRAYFMTGERKDRIFLNYLLARAIGKERIFFMNVECRTTHSIQWGTELSSSPILALPVNWIDPTWQPSEKTTVRVVSVGRLVDFKTYNLGAARIVKACLDRGVTVMWDIFGDGPLHGSIKAEIEAMGVASYVRLMGALDYKDFAATVAGYDLFVGMGTAALEAAMVGVPTICATVDEATRCYGYLHSLPYGNVGELQSKPPTVELAELIQSYSVSAQTQRALLSKQSRTVAEKYGMPKFGEAVTNMAVSNHASPPRFVKRAISELYRFATEGYLIKVLRQRLSKKERAA